MTSFSILGINHVGLAPKDPQKARWFLEEALSLRFAGDEHVKDQHTLTTMFAARGDAAASAGDASESRLEILASDGDANSPIGKFLEKKGSGIHHLAMHVDNVEAAITCLVAKGVRMIDSKPRLGAHKTRIAFVHPESTGGLLIELVQEAAE